jgi:hypothetical protein
MIDNETDNQNAHNQTIESIESEMETSSHNKKRKANSPQEGRENIINTSTDTDNNSDQGFTAQKRKKKKSSRRTSEQFLKHQIQTSAEKLSQKTKQKTRQTLITEQIIIRSEGKRGITKDEQNIIHTYIKHIDFNYQVITYISGKIFAKMSENKYKNMDKTISICNQHFHVSTNNQGKPYSPQKPDTNQDHYKQQTAKQNIEKPNKTFKYVEKRLAKYNENTEDIMQILNNKETQIQTQAECIEVTKWDNPYGWSTITFKQEPKNTKIYTDGHVYTLTKYTPKLPKCGYCQKWGHTTKYCKLSNLPAWKHCSRCGGNHANIQCTNVIKCSNCGQDHASHTKNCPAKLSAEKKWNDKQQEINTNKLIKTQISNKVKQVEKEVLQKTNTVLTRAKKTFAEVAANKTTSNETYINSTQLTEILEILLTGSTKYPTIQIARKNINQAIKLVTNTPKTTQVANTPTKNTPTKTSQPTLTHTPNKQGKQTTNTNNNSSTPRTPNRTLPPSALNLDKSTSKKATKSKSRI